MSLVVMLHNACGIGPRGTGANESCGDANKCIMHMV